MFLLVTGVGGGIGVACGPAYIDRRGGFNTPPGVVTSLEALQYMCRLAAVAGLAGAACLYGKNKMDGNLSDWGDHWLWLLWCCVFVIWAAHNGCIAALCGINIEVIPSETRTFAAGGEMTVRNILGYAFGPLLPGFAMDIVGSEVEDNSKTQLCAGMGLVLVINALCIFLTKRAAECARRDLVIQQTSSMKELREALTLDERETLEQAVRNARRLNVQLTAGGEAVLGAANEAIGYLRKGKKRPSASKVDPAHRDLEARICLLEKENAELKSDLKEYTYASVLMGFRKLRINMNKIAL